MSGTEFPSSPGPGVDAAGRAVIDPTENVRQLVVAAIQRQDDLRGAESSHVREMVELRAGYDEKLREAESNRIDAIRAVDVAAVIQQQSAAETRASALAKQVSDAAEAMRTQVAAAAAASATALAAALEPIQKDIQDLRKAQYEAQGQKTQVVETRASGSSFGMWAAVVVGVLALAGGLYAGTRSTGPALVPVQPVTVTVPK